MSAAEQDVQQVVARYGLALDSHDHEALGALHSEQAQWEFAIGGQVVLGPILGRDAILDFVSPAEDSGRDQERHLLTNIVVTHESESTSRALAYLTLVSNRGGVPTISATALVRFVFAASEDGWLIEELRVEFDNPPVPR